MSTFYLHYMTEGVRRKNFSTAENAIAVIATVNNSKVRESNMQLKIALVHRLDVAVVADVSWRTGRQRVLHPQVGCKSTFVPVLLATFLAD